MNRSALERSLSKRLDRRRQNATIRSLSIPSDTAIDFSSNDFLSLATSLELQEAFVEEIQNGLKSHGLGSGGSRLLDGNSRYAERLEQRIADFHRAPAGLLCNSGYDANVGLFSTLPQPDDIVLYDELIHASVHDGMRASRATKSIPFRHNDVAHLRTILDECIASYRSIRDGRSNVFIAVEAVYSMDGDRAPLADVVRLKNDRLPLGNGHLIVDEAHATGVIGPQGRGLVCELGLEDQVTVRLHTFGKALACNGAILLCSPVVRHYLINYARPLIYTTFMSFPNLAAIKVVYDHLLAGKAEPLIRKLDRLVEALHLRLHDYQHAYPRATCSSSSSSPSSPETVKSPPFHRTAQSAIFSMQTTDPKSLAAYCQRQGFIVRAIVAPTVPAGSERIRICLHAGNTIEQVDALTKTIHHWTVSRRPPPSSSTPLRSRL